VAENGNTSGIRNCLLLFVQLLYSLNFSKKFIFWMTGNVDKAGPVYATWGVVTAGDCSHAFE
jgi:hypothetical protein